MHFTFSCDLPLHHHVKKYSACQGEQNRFSVILCILGRRQDMSPNRYDRGQGSEFLRVVQVLIKFCVTATPVLTTLQRSLIYFWDTLWIPTLDFRPVSGYFISWKIAQLVLVSWLQAEALVTPVNSFETANSWLPPMEMWPKWNHRFFLVCAIRRPLLLKARHVELSL